MSDKSPIHEQCIKHPFKCDQINKLEQRQNTILLALEKFMPARHILTIHALLGVVYIALFSLSVSMNAMAIDAVTEARKERIEAINTIASVQKDILITIGKLGITVENNRKGLKECQKDVKETRNPHAPMRGYK